MLGDYIHANFGNASEEKPRKRFQKQGSSLRRKVLADLKEESNPQPQIDSGSPCNNLKHRFQEFIGHFDHTPSFLKYNPFLQTGYRINFNTPKKVVKSLFMLHNESVNIWTHLCGGIALMIISLFLCFSVNSFDSHTLQIFVKQEVGQLFKPVISSLPNLTQIEHEFSDNMLHTRDDIIKFGNNTLSGFESTLHTIKEEIEHVKENLNPEVIGKFLNKLKDQLEANSNIFEGFKLYMTLNQERRAKIVKLTQTVEKDLHELQARLISKIDSAAFDWIDVYRYIKPTYSNDLMTKDDGFRRVPLSRWPIIVFLLSAVFCLMCSAIYHAFHCISDRASQILSRLDYAGISILITGSCFPPFVYGFYCQPFYSQLYLTLIAIVSIIVFIVSLGEKIHEFEYAVVKSTMYGGLVFCAILPVCHLIYLNVTATGESDNLDFIPSIPYYVAMILCYLVGLIIYATKYPERCCPGKFDLLGHSHQIWHICVLLGIVFTYLGAFDNYYTRIKIPCMGCDL